MSARGALTGQVLPGLAACAVRCELLVAESQETMGPGAEATGWAAGCELVFASPLAAAAGPGPGAEAAGSAGLGC